MMVEEARLWSVLGGEVEQPLAQLSVVLFQVLDQVGLLLHHFLQTGALPVTDRSTEGLCHVAESIIST